MIVNLEQYPLDEFKEVIFNMPSPWLLHYFKVLHEDNEEYHKLIDIVLDVDDTLDDDAVVDKQIECFNRLIAVSNVLVHRNIPIPNFRVQESF